MIYATRGFKAALLSLLVAVGLAVPAASAQAVTWDIGGKEITSDADGTGGKLVAGQEALILVAAQNLVIHCNKFTIENSLLIVASNTAKANLNMEGCKTLVKGVESAGCKPEILLVKALFKPILHNSEVYLLVSPQETNFTTFHYNEETCALPSLPVVNGSLVMECYKGALVHDNCATAKVVHTVRAVSNLALFSDSLKYGLSTAEIHAELELFATGSQAGETFNALI